MYLDQYIKIAKTNLFFICALTAVGAVCGYLSVAHIESGYKAQQTIFVRIEKSNPLAYESVDAQTITDTVVAYISSTDYQRKANKTSQTNAKKVAAQVVTLTATSQNLEEAQNSLKNTTTNFNQVAPDLIRHAKVELTNVGEQAIPTKNALNSRVLALFGTLLGFAASISIISVSRYFRL